MSETIEDILTTIEGMADDDREAYSLSFERVGASDPHVAAEFDVAALRQDLGIPKQHALLIRQKLQACDTSSGEGSNEPLKDVLDDSSASLMPATPQTQCDAVKWFNTTFECQFTETTQVEIVSLLHELLNNATKVLAPSHVMHWKTLFRLLYERDGMLEEGLAELRRHVMYRLLRGKDKCAGKSQGMVAITLKDFNHLLHCQLEEFGPSLPTKTIQRDTYLAIAVATGKHKGEIDYISPSSLALEILEVDIEGHRAIVHNLVGKCCWSQRTGPGVYNFSLFESPDENFFDELRSMAIPFLLVYLQRIGAIESALDVYDGMVSLEIDPGIWESPRVLSEKLRQAKGDSTNENPAMRSEDISDGMHVRLKTIDEKDNHLPLWMHSDSQNRFHSTRIDFRTQRVMCENVLRYGYTPSVSLRAGVTRTHQNFRQSSTVETPAGNDSQAQNPGVAEKLSETDEVPAAYENPKFFLHEKVTPRTAALPWLTAREFIVSQSAPCETSFRCPGIFCGAIYRFEGDLVEHMTKHCADFFCVHCKSENTFKKYNLLKNHYCPVQRQKSKEDEARREKVAKLDFMICHPCERDGCTSVFRNAKALRKHMNDHCSKRPGGKRRGKGDSRKRKGSAKVAKKEAASVLTDITNAVADPTDTCLSSDAGGCMSPQSRG